MFAMNAKVTDLMKPVFSLDDFLSGKIGVDPGWLNEIWGKWPGGETVEELLAALDDH
jgi:hypothetical protein